MKDNLWIDLLTLPYQVPLMLESSSGIFYIITISPFSRVKSETAFLRKNHHNYFPVQKNGRNCTCTSSKCTTSDISFLDV